MTHSDPCPYFKTNCFGTLQILSIKRTGQVCELCPTEIKRFRNIMNMWNPHARFRPELEEMETGEHSSKLDIIQNKRPK